MPRTNRDQLLATASLLRPVLSELVFVGGAITGELITDQAAGEPRATFDVDVIAELSTYAEYTLFGERLRGLGFTEDTAEGSPVCRWIQGAVVLDVMPLENKVLGFTNRWYRKALRTATLHTLAEDLQVRIITPAAFLATKLEAFKGRGHNDFFGSHDLEDVIFVIDGRANLVEELGAETAELKSYLRDEIAKLLETPRFLDALPGYLSPDTASQARIRLVLSRLHQISTL